MLRLEDDAGPRLLAELGSPVESLLLSGDTLYFTLPENGTVAALDLRRCATDAPAPGRCVPAPVLRHGPQQLQGQPRTLAVDESRG